MIISFFHHNFVMWVGRGEMFGLNKHSIPPNHPQKFKVLRSKSLYKKGRQLDSRQA